MVQFVWYFLNSFKTVYFCSLLKIHLENIHGLGKFQSFRESFSCVWKIFSGIERFFVVTLYSKKFWKKTLNTTAKEIILHAVCIWNRSVGEIAHKSSHPGPYQLLVNALQRQDLHPTKPTPKMNHLPHLKTHLKNTYTMTAGDYKATYTHQIKKFAQQMCAQLILKQMHPELKYYGDLLRLYGRKVDREKVKRKEDQRSITDLQTKGKWGEPNWELLEKLKAVMQTVIPVPLKPGETSRIRYWIRVYIT